VEIEISSRGTDLSEPLNAATRRKIGRLARFVEGMEIARVHFSEEKNPRIVDREICEVVIEGRGQRVHCKVAAPDGFGALDKAVEKLEHQLGTLKSKVAVRGHRS
jgi:putative sigma-54 modulation protein